MTTDATTLLDPELASIIEAFPTEALSEATYRQRRQKPCSPAVAQRGRELACRQRRRSDALGAARERLAGIALRVRIDDPHRAPKAIPGHHQRLLGVPVVGRWRHRSRP